jgi:UPF0755 protein
MTKRRSSRLPLLLATLLFFSLCVLALVVTWSVTVVPRQAAQIFGPPSPSLSTADRFIYPVRLFMEQNDLLIPVDALGKEETFKIEMGESVPTVANRLQDGGIIRSSSAFRHYLIYSGLDTGVQAGEYQLSPALNAIQIARALQDATPAEVSFSILPGWRAEEIADALPTSGLSVTKEDFLDLVNHPGIVDVPSGWPKLKTLEGFLYPDVYRLKRDISAKEMVETFLNRFDQEVTPDVRDGLQNQGFTLKEGVTLASIVQREAVVAEEQPMIASVFINRLNSGMKLESDPTAQYSLGYNAEQNTWWTNPLSAGDLRVRSAFNTYVNTGLPPAPISNPALSAIRAVAFPAQTPYYFFRARCDQSGRHLFAKTYQEHLNNGCQ